ncbi:HNH endonuclease [Eubacteriales bacterium OttesenSCG-928-A19]|nr:HNH endonuclease [Eubacteriales bacterium OttesenSCG-928-A19]
MPRKPKRPCNHPGCPALTDGRYCDKHKKMTNAHYNKYERDPASSKRYGADWRRIRARYIAAHPLCERCLEEGRHTPAETVHHRVELSAGGSHAEENLCSLCFAHHSAIHMAKRNKQRNAQRRKASR